MYSDITKDPLIETVRNVIEGPAFDIVESADVPDKLVRDAQSLKKAGWNMQKITHHLLTNGDYDGVKITSDMIDKILKPKVVAKAPKPPKEKPWKAPKNPVGSQANNKDHAEKFAAGWTHPDASSEGGGDMGGGELYSYMSNAGYTDAAIEASLRNLGIINSLADLKRKPMAKKRPKQR